MRKLVLGIIALISVQFAFVTYMMVLQSPMQLTDGTAPTQPVRRNPYLARIEHFTTSNEVVPQPDVEAPAAEPRHAYTLRVAEPVVPERAAKRYHRLVNHVSKPAFAIPPRSAAPVEFESVVISYHRPSKPFDCPTRDTPKTFTPETPIAKAKKRSYLAKASPVIKKPWEWIKTVASKLN
jgi:hypothetical protein